MKILARRLQSVIKSLVGPHQTCGIKGRTIFTDVHTARSALDCCDGNAWACGHVAIRSTQGFDKVVHQVLFSILDYVNVRTVITEGVKMMHNGCSAKLVINRQLSESIPVQSSVR